MRDKWEIHVMIQVPGMWPYDADILSDEPSTTRLRAISVVWAAQAARFPDVREFRHKYLGDTLLAADQVESWVTTLPESSRPPARWLCNIPIERLIAVADGSYIVPKDIMEEAWQNSRDESVAPTTRMRYLIYAIPTNDKASEPIRAAGGVLDTLRGIALRLVKFHGGDDGGLWHEAQATTFVLTGYVPLVPFGAFPLPARSGRRQTEKHLQLAAFKAQQDALKTPPAEQLAIWNARFPQWSYKNTTNYGWDSRQALARLPVYTPEHLKVAASFAEKQRQQLHEASAAQDSEMPE